MSRLPQRNATLTAIAGPGFSAEGDEPATQGDAKWTGSSDAYVTEKRLTSTAAGRLDLFDRTTVVIPGDLRPSVDIARGDSVTYVYAGAERTRTVRDVAAALMAGVPSTVRIELEDV